MDQSEENQNTKQSADGEIWGKKILSGSMRKVMINTEKNLTPNVRAGDAL